MGSGEKISDDVFDWLCLNVVYFSGGELVPKHFAHRDIRMSLYCLGLNHKTCSVEIREQLAFMTSHLDESLQHLRQIEALSECCILSTCNRVEIYFRGNGESIEEVVIHFLAEHHRVPEEIFRPFLYRYAGEEVVRHLFRVACGLDSLVVGENEIFGQLKTAFREA